MKKLLKSVLFLLVLSSSVSCGLLDPIVEDPDEPIIPDPTPVEPVIPDIDPSTIECVVETHSILTGTPFETPVYKFTSNIEGPKCCIVGGIHGDEIAGWKCANELIKRTDFVGTVLIIPNANIIADTLENRYPGVSNGGKISSKQLKELKENPTFDGRDMDSLEEVKFADLNRAFPGKENGTTTQKIAYAITQEVTNFNPDYLVDLHESQYSHTIEHGASDTTYLGNLVIYGGIQSWEFADKVAFDFNDKFKEEGEEDFDTYEGTVLGSHCNTFGKNLPNCKVMTFETIRHKNDGKTFSATRRTEQQIQLCSIFLKNAYTEYVLAHAEQ